MGVKYEEGRVKLDFSITDLTAVGVAAVIAAIAFPSIRKAVTIAISARGAYQVANLIAKHKDTIMKAIVKTPITGVSGYASLDKTNKKCYGGGNRKCRVVEI